MLCLAIADVSGWYRQTDICPANVHRRQCQYCDVTEGGCCLATSSWAYVTLCTVAEFLPLVLQIHATCHIF